MFADDKLELRDLLPNTSYVITVRARNAVGAGGSISVPVTTLPPRESTSYVFREDCTCFFVFFLSVICQIYLSNILHKIVYRKYCSSRCSVLNDPPERAVLGSSSGVQEVHVELLQVICHVAEPS